jgi:hypothetical protein
MKPCFRLKAGFSLERVVWAIVTGLQKNDLEGEAAWEDLIYLMARRKRKKTLNPTRQNHLFMATCSFTR